MSYKGSGKKFMDVVTYTGNGGTQSIDGLEFSPDLVWIKNRSSTSDHRLTDTVRGVTKEIYSNLTNAEDTRSNGLTAFNADGFTVGSNASYNQNGSDHVAWCWNAGDTTEEIAVDSLNNSKFNQTQTWSDLVTGTPAGAGSSSPNTPFQGTYGTSYTDGITPDNGSYLSMNFGTTFNSATTLKLTVYASIPTSTTTNSNFKINGTDINTATYGAGMVGPAGQHTVTLSLPDGLDSLEWGYQSGGNTGYMYIENIEIDGKLLVNSNVSSGLPSIPSTVRANQDAGFSVVKYTGDGGNTASRVAHGLGRQPKFMMVKNLGRATNWEVYHDSTPGNLYYLNTTDTKQVSSTFTGTDENTFNVADTVINATGENIVAYVWSEVPGFSKFGSYLGGTSSAPPFVYTGFKTRWIMMKASSVVGSWVMYDTQRDPNGTGEGWLYANSSSTEQAAATYAIETTSNGFRMVGDSAENNGNGVTYIYMAFAEQPFGKAQKKQLTFSSSRDFDEVIKDDVLTQYPNSTASGSVASKDKEASTIDIYTDGLSSSSNFLTNSNQTYTKPVTDPSNKRWTWSAWVKRSESGTSQNVFSAGGLNIAFDENDKLIVGISPFTYYYVSGTPSNLNDVLTNGTLYTGQNIATNQNFVMVNTGGEVRSGSAFLTVGGFRFGLDNSRPGGYYATDGTRFGGAGTYNESNWTDMFFTTRDQEENYDESYGIYTNPEVSYILMGNYENSSGQPGTLSIGGLVTTETFTDVSVWMHVLVSCDTVGGEGFKLYVNGDEVTAFDVKSQPGVGASTTINTTGVDQFIGTDLSGYVADVQFIDGQVITPDRLLRNNDTREGQLYPTRYDGWYGTRGYRLPMSTTEPKSSEITNVSVVDYEATVTSGTIANSRTVSDMFGSVDMVAGIDGGDANLVVSFGQSLTGNLTVNVRSNSSDDIPAGTCTLNTGESFQPPNVSSNASIYSFGSVSGVTGFTLQGTGVREGGITVGYWALDGVPLLVSGTNSTLNLTDDQDLDAFAVGDEVTQYTSDPISAPTTAFSTTLWEGNGVSQAIVSGIDNTEKSLVWVKSRDVTRWHILTDTVRGISNALSTNDQQGQAIAPNNFPSFNSDGFNVGSENEVNFDDENFVGWNFKAAPKFFDIVQYTGTGATFDGAPHDVPHSLTTEPGCIIVKCTEVSSQWIIYHKSLGYESTLYFTTSDADSGAGDRNFGPMTATTFGVVASADTAAGGANNNIAYLFANEPGLIKCGSYTGNGSPTGPVVDCGFEPQWLMIKFTDGINQWVMYDSARNPSDPRNTRLVANTPDAENTSSNIGIDFISNGFQIVGDASSINTNNGNYIYVAIAKNALASGTTIPTGTVASVDRYVPSLTLSNASSGWTTGDNAAVIGPEKYITDLQDQNRFTWTKTNLDETDVMVDTPNNYGIDNGLGGEQRGNYATLSPLDETNATLTNGNLDVEVNTAGTNYTNGTIAISSGKWYFETTVVSGINNAVGVSDINGTSGFEANGSYVYYQDTGALWYTSAVTYGENWKTAGDVIGVAIDMDTPQLTFYKNGVSQGVGVTSWLSGKTITPCFTCGGGSGNKVVANFGATPFTYPAPIGYKTLNSTNLEDPLIPVGNTQMDVITYTGTGANQTISGLSFSPDLVWIKDRTDPNSHSLYDTVRGPGKVLFSNLTNSEQTQTGGLMGFNSDGFDLVGVNTDSGATNQNNAEYVAWTWNAGDSTVLNTSGSVASQVRANPLAGFSIVTATLGAGEDVGHGLGVTPSMVIAKPRDQAANWYVQFPGLMGDGRTLYLNGVDGETPDATWATPAATSSVLKVNSQNVSNLSSPSDWVFYCWSEVPGFSSFGSYVGNGSATSGPFINTGFKPAYVMIKKTSGNGSWFMYDNQRNTSDPRNSVLWADLTSQEVTQDAYNIDFGSTGFKIKPNPNNDELNGSYGTYIYAAFAETPTQFLPQ